MYEIINDVGGFVTLIFNFDDRLGISIPQLPSNWEQISTDEEEAYLLQWEQIRGDIPDRIKQLEETIYVLQNRLYEEEDFEKSCEINTEIAELASVINDLWILYRTGGDISTKKDIHS